MNAHHTSRNHTEGPRLLDVCGCEGGGSDGYRRAGFRVYVIDLDPNRLRHNPYPSHCGDATEALAALAAGLPVRFVDQDGNAEWLTLADFAAVHVSPPCQWYTRGRAKDRGKPSRWERTIPVFREAVKALGLPYVIENVPDARWDMDAPVMLCGCMFGLKTEDTDGTTLHLKRQRLFETDWPLAAPRPCDHTGIQQWAGVYGGARRDKWEARHVRRGGYVPPDKSVAAALLGITHPMTWQGLYECLPPAYTEFIGRRLLSHLTTLGDPR